MTSMRNSTSPLNAKKRAYKRRLKADLKNKGLPQVIPPTGQSVSNVTAGVIRSWLIVKICLPLNLRPVENLAARGKKPA